MFNTQPAPVYGINARHERHIAYCCRCNSPWGACGCAGQGAFPINRQNEQLMLETQLRRSNGFYGPNQQAMFCGGCSSPWGGCRCVGVVPVCSMGEALLFEGLMIGGAALGIVAAEAAVEVVGDFVEDVVDLFDPDFE